MAVKSNEGGGSLALTDDGTKSARKVTNDKTENLYTTIVETSRT